METRLAYFCVDGLFGQYKNEITLKLEERLTAVIGPNGRGKTVCLRLIDALYKRNYWYFTTVEFDKLTFRFTNNVEFVVSRLVRDYDLDADESPKRRIPITIDIKVGSKRRSRWQPTLKTLRGQAVLISRHMPWLTRVGPSHWIDERTGERLLVDALINRYGQMLPPGALRGIEGDEPDNVTKTLRDTDCHLIETQRLLAFSDDDRAIYDRARRAEPNLVVQQKAKLLRQYLQNQLAEYGILSQRLDRSFPRRVIEGSFARDFSFEEISSKLKKLEEQRKALEQAGILDADPEQVFAIPQNTDRTVGKVLSVYAEDTEKKLDNFSLILSQINLFRDIINDRFISKHIDIDKNEGFRIISDVSGKEIPLDKLSSGEQHHLILVFEILFELKKNSLVMIDEPEISLHVSWQKKFIGDLKRIIDLNQVDVILATHSPQLIGRWRELAVELGEVDG